MLVYIKPLSLFPKLHSDTLFGAITSAINELFPDMIEEMIDKFKNNNPPFILSSAFPYMVDKSEKIRFYPKIITENKSTADRNILKEFKKIEYMEEKIFFDLINAKISENDILDNFNDYFVSANLLMSNDYKVKIGYSKSILPNNSVNRLTNETEAIFYSEGDEFKNMGLFFFVEIYDEKYEAIIKSALKFLKDRGFGKDISSGKGQFTYEIEDSSINDLNDNEGNMFITLSRFIPTEDNLKRINEFSFYEIESKRGKDSSGEIRKQVRFFKEGSIFPDYQKYYGKIVKSGEVNPAIEYGYAFPVKGELK